MHSLTYATLFVCGVHTTVDFDWWVRPLLDFDVTVIVAGKCAISTSNYPNVVARRVRRPLDTDRARDRAKFALWTLSYDRVVYYDMSILVRPPDCPCLSQCTAPLCAVRDPESGDPTTDFMVIRPSMNAYVDLATTVSGPESVAVRDVIQWYFGKDWTALPAECNPRFV